jgi:hypothetical protein
MVAEAKTAVLAPRTGDLGADATLELGQLELRSASADLRSESRGMSAAAQPSWRWALVAGAAVVAAALVVGGIALTRSPHAPSSPAARPSATAAVASPLAAVAPPSAAPPRETAPSAPPTAPATKPVPPPPPQPAPVPAAPKRARLIVGPAWDPAMVVEVAGRRLRLDREQRLEVPAGVTVLRFSLERREYSAEEPLRLELRPGASERVSIPIDRPGRLTVQPHLGARPGLVRIDGQPRGSSPLRGAWIPPGNHFLEIYASPTDADPAWSRSLDVRSGVETIVTFDLDGRSETLVRERPAESP